MFCGVFLEEGYRNFVTTNGGGEGFLGQGGHPRAQGARPGSGSSTGPLFGIVSRRFYYSENIHKVQNYKFKAMGPQNSLKR